MRSRTVSLALSCIITVGQAQWVKQTGGLPLTWGEAQAIGTCSPAVAVIVVKGASPFVYRTWNGGSQFLPVSVPAFPADIVVVDSFHLWFVSGSSIYASQDGGASWHEQYSDPLTTQSFDYIKMFNLNEGVAVGDAPAGKPLAVLRTVNGGLTWASMNTSHLIGMTSGDTWRRIHFANVMVGYFCSSVAQDSPQKIYKTTDGGVTWVPVFAQSGMTIVRFYDDQIGLISSYTGQPSSPTGILFHRTMDGGVTWQTTSSSIFDPTSALDIEFLPVDPSRVWATNGSKLFFSQDTGHLWVEQVISSSTNNGRDLALSDTAGWLLCDSGTVYYTLNAKKTTRYIDPRIVRLEHRAVEYHNHISHVNTLTVDMGPPCVAVRDTVIRGRIIRVDFAHPPPITFHTLFEYVRSDTMTLRQGRAILSFPWRFYSIDLDNFLCPDSSLRIEYEVVDVESNKVIQKALETDIRKGKSMVMDSLSGQYVSGYSVKGMRTQAFDATEGQRIITRMKLNTSALVDSTLLTWYIVGTSYSYADSNEYLKYYPFLSFELPYHVANFASSVSRAAAVPSSLSLEQNYPNPFNPSTTIRFGVSTRSNVRVTIFNILGQQVTELVNREMNAGYFEQIWDASVASGLYFYRIEAVSVDDPSKRFVDVKKMILLK